MSCESGGHRSDGERRHECAAGAGRGRARGGDRRDRAPDARTGTRRRCAGSWPTSRTRTCRRVFAGADAVIHLAWLIQPSRDAAQLERVNVHGSRRVFETAIAAGVAGLVHASSVGVYSPGPKDRAVDESWAREGVDSLFYARHKAECEHMLDGLEGRGTTIVRLRPGLIFKREAGPEIRRLFAGPFAARVAAQAGPHPRAAAARPSVRAVRARRRHRQRLPARGARAARRGRLQHRRRPGPRPRHAGQGPRRPPHPRPGAARPRRRRPHLARAPAARPGRLGRHGPRRPDHGHLPRAASTSAGPRRSTRPPPCASSWPACASPRASTPHRCAPTPAAPCASANSSPASAAEPKRSIKGSVPFRFGAVRRGRALLT